MVSADSTLFFANLEAQGLGYVDGDSCRLFRHDDSSTHKMVMKIDSYDDLVLLAMDIHATCSALSCVAGAKLYNSEDLLLVLYLTEGEEDDMQIEEAIESFNVVPFHPYNAAQDGDSVLWLAWSDEGDSVAIKWKDWLDGKVTV